MFRIMVLSLCIFCASPFQRAVESKHILSSEFPKYYNEFDDYSLEVSQKPVEDLYDSDDDIIIYESDLAKLDKNNNNPLKQYQSMYYTNDNTNHIKDHRKHHRKHSLPKVHSKPFIDEPIVVQPRKTADTSSSEEVMTYEVMSNIFAGMNEKKFDTKEIIIELPVAEFNNLEYDSNEEEFLGAIHTEDMISKDKNIDSIVSTDITTATGTKSIVETTTEIKTTETTPCVPDTTLSEVQTKTLPEDEKTTVKPIETTKSTTREQITTPTTTSTIVPTIQPTETTSLVKNS